VGELEEWDKALEAQRDPYPYLLNVSLATGREARINHHGISKGYCGVAGRGGGFMTSIRWKERQLEGR
jgi:hypothetical protein